MVAVRMMRNMLMELRKVCQHPYLSAPELENEDASEEEQHRQLTNGAGKLAFLKLLLPKLKERGHRVLLFSQFKIALDIIEDFLAAEGYKFLRLDGDVQQAKRQKAMDAYNAPDSDYFIFLLTTRAGGVGINLATADTVIIYDPDFNPHMDLQAISRSHRYGQKKRVLVFKLMTKNSVEEQIILSGKKKMVLDHLVVQQMGKENEEGDIDDLLLRGAAALYDANEEGVAESDIRYTSKDVDELIDKCEADAEAEAKAMEQREKEKEQAKERGETAPEDGQEGEASKPKETMSFGFAKIWEADRNRLGELGDDEDRPEDENAWQLVVENARKAREAEKLALMENGRAKRQAAIIRYGPDGPLSSSDELTPEKKAKRKSSNKGKGKLGSSSEDSDFIGGVYTSDSDSEDLVLDGDGPANLVDAEGNTIVRGLAAGRKMSRKQLLMAARARMAVQNGQSLTGTGPSMDANGNLIDPSPVIGNAQAEGSTGRPALADITQLAKPKEKVDKSKETPEERAARKARRKVEKELQRQHRFEQMMDAAQQRQQHPQPNGGPSVPGPSRHPIGITPAGGGPQANGDAGIRTTLDQASIQFGQQICQYLYHVIREFRIPDGLPQWARMALPEMPPQTREDIYRHLAQLVDVQLYMKFQERYFDLEGQLQYVLPLLRNHYPVIPDENGFAGSIPPLYPTMGRYREDVDVARIHRVPVAQPQSQHQPPPVHDHPARASPAMREIGNTSRSPAVSTSAALSTNGPKRISLIEAAAAAAAVKGGGVPARHTPPVAPAALPSLPRATTQAIAPQNDSPLVPPLHELRQLRDQVIHGSEPDEVKIQAVARIDDMLRLHAETSGEDVVATSSHAGPAAVAQSTIVDQPVASSSRQTVQGESKRTVPLDSTPNHKPASVTATPSASRRSMVRARSSRSSIGTPGQTKEDAILVPDDDDDDGAGVGANQQVDELDEDDDHRPVKKQRKSLTSPRGVGRPRNFKGCQICGASQSHAAMYCPVVQEGPESIKAAMRQFEPSDPLWLVLRHLYDEKTASSAEPASDPTHLCAFCNRACGRTIRECAEANGGRKALKERIKKLEYARQGGELLADEVEVVKRQVEELYNAYLKWPRAVEPV